MRLSERIKRLQPSATLTITACAKKMKGEGKDVLIFAAGEPDFDTPEHIKSAAKKALDEGFTKYTPTSGIDELKTAICLRYKDDYKVSFEPKNVIITVGGKHAAFNTFLALLNPGDEVIIPAPYWVSYPPMVEIAGGVPKIVYMKEEDGFVPKIEDIEAAITEKTRAIVINSPSNPTGCIISKQTLQEIYDLCRSKNVFVISDEIYDKMVYGVEPMTMLSLDGADFSNLVILNGVSKSYSMTGWRIGYAIGDEALISAIGKIQDQSTSNPTSFAQKGALQALLGPQEELKTMIQEFDERRKIVHEGLSSIDGLFVVEPKGAFYIFPNFSSYYGRKSQSGKVILNSLDMADYLLNEVGVCLIPGEPFGSDNHLRLSFAANREELKEGLNRIEWALSKIS